MVQCNRVPTSLVMDNAKEQISGTFCKKAKQARCCIKQTGAYSPWSNAAEGIICELKHSAGNKMTK